MTEIAVVQIDGVLKGSPGETQHICWQCPRCKEWYSDDWDESLENPYISTCGWTRKYDDGKVIKYMISW